MAPFPREAAIEGITVRALSGYCNGEEKIEGLVLGYAPYDASALIAASEKPRARDGAFGVTGTSGREWLHERGRRRCHRR